MRKSLLLFLLVAGCAAAPTQNSESEHKNTLAEIDYEGILKRWTTRDEAYQDYSQSYIVLATMISRELKERQINSEADHMHWTPSERQENLQKASYDLQTNTTFFVSLYTQNDVDNNLDKKDSIWNIFLDVNGKRVQPTSIKKIYENKAVLQTKYPYLDPWSKNYYVTFPVPADSVSDALPQMTIAGPFGASHLKFAKGEPNN